MITMITVACARNIRTATNTSRENAGAVNALGQALRDALNSREREDLRELELFRELHQNGGDQETFSEDGYGGAPTYNDVPAGYTATPTEGGQATGGGATGTDGSASTGTDAAPQSGPLPSDSSSATSSDRATATTSSEGTAGSN